MWQFQGVRTGLTLLHTFKTLNTQDLRPYRSLNCDYRLLTQNFCKRSDHQTGIISHFILGEAEFRFLNGALVPCPEVAPLNEWMNLYLLCAGTTNDNEKALRQTQTLHAGCSKARPKISSRRRPPFRGAGRPKLISWRWSLLLPTNPVWWGSMHAISSYRGNRPTNTHHTHKQTGPITIHCAAASAQSNHTTN